MKLTKFRKAFLMSALSVGIVLGVTSCVQSYTVGYLYVTGTQTTGTSTSSQSADNGIISGFKIDHNTGNLVPINGLPISSGGSNPARAVLINSGRFLYVLNQGVNHENGAVCTPTDTCQASITQFAIGGNGVLSPQGVSQTPQGFNSTRIVADGQGNFIYVLDGIAPSASACALALGSNITSCGDITAYKVDPNTGRLTLVVNSQVTSATGEPLPYFPVPASPIDFVLSGGYVLTVSGTPATGDIVFPYTYSASNGQLTINQNGPQTLNLLQATAIVGAPSGVFVLSNDPLTITNNGSTTTVPSQIIQYSIGSNGSLQAVQAGPVGGPASLSHPIYLINEKNAKWTYVAFYGDNNTTTGNSESGIGGYIIDPGNKTLDEGQANGSPYGSGSGPVCLLEDPSSQFIYTANFNDSTVSGLVLDQNVGSLNPLSQNHSKIKNTFALPGPPTWCLASGRTS